MANTKEIQNRINSIQDTMKITKAMYMMSSMKLRKAKQKLTDTEPFFFGVQEQIANVLVHFPDYQSVFFENRIEDEQKPEKKTGYIVVTGDKGMAGAYNHNAIKAAVELIGDNKDNAVLYVVGEVGRSYFMNQGYHVDEEFHFSANNPSMHRARVIAEYLIDLFAKDELDEIQIIYTKMLNSIAEETCVEQLLPLKTHAFLKQQYQEKKEQESEGAEVKEKTETEQKSRNLNSFELEAMENGDDWTFFNPSPKKVLKSLVYNFVTGFAYGALVECSASEENARMMAMQSATDNAEAMLHELSIEYNRVRQAAITQEITEVIGGAKALKKKKKKQTR